MAEFIVINFYNISTWPHIYTSSAIEMELKNQQYFKALLVIKVFQDLFIFYKFSIKITLRSEVKTAENLTENVWTFCIEQVLMSFQLRTHATFHTFSVNILQLFFDFNISPV